MTITTLIPTEKLNKVTRNARHQYQHEDYPDELWPGVTTALGIIDKPGLRQWAADEASDVLKATLLDPDLREMLPDWIDPEDENRYLEWVDAKREEARKAHTVKRDTGADFGTRSHEMIASFLRDEMITVPEELTPVYEAFIDWHDWHYASGLTIHMSETIVYSETYKYGGTVDAIAERDGKLVVIDWKTSNYNAKLKTGIYPEMALQVGAYALALEEMTGEKVEEAWVVRFGKKEPEFEAKPVLELHSAKRGFVDALELHRTMKEKLI